MQFAKYAETLSQKRPEDLSWPCYRTQYIKSASDVTEDKEKILCVLFVEKNMSPSVYTFYRKVQCFYWEMK